MDTLFAAYVKHYKLDENALHELVVKLIDAPYRDISYDALIILINRLNKYEVTSLFFELTQLGCYISLKMMDEAEALYQQLIVENPSLMVSLMTLQETYLQSFNGDFYVFFEEIRTWIIGREPVAVVTGNEEGYSVINRV